MFKNRKFFQYNLLDCMFLVILLALCVMLVAETSRADTSPSFYVMVNPGEHVNVRNSPQMGSEITGRLYLGDEVQIESFSEDGEWSMCNGIASEAGKGWVQTVYLTGDEPQMLPEGSTATIASNGRVAVRRGMNGERVRWCKNGDVVDALAMNSGYLVTSDGFIRLEYIAHDEGT